MHHKRLIPAVLSVFTLCLLCACGVKPEPVPTVAPTPIPTVEVKAPQANIIVTEFMEKNRSIIRDEDGDFSDYIELYNADSKSVNLRDWRISDSPEQKGWKFPDVSIAPGEYLLIFASNKEKEDSRELHADFALSGDEGVYLKDANGTLVYEVSCGGCDGNIAMVNKNGTWEKSTWASPGFENSNAGYARYQQTLSPTGPLVINEVMSFDKQLLNEDWVEIKNISESPVQLADYCLSDDDDDYKLFNLPDYELRPGECYVILCGDELTGFALSSDTEKLYLSHSDGSLSDFAALHSIPYGCSMGRMAGEAGMFYFAKPSPNRDNSDGCRLISAMPESLTKDGVYNDVESVTVELSAPGTIRYTTDGSAPHAGSTEYTGPITLNKTAVIRAVCFEENALPSRALSLSYIINENHTLPVLSLVTDSPYSFKLMYDNRQKHVEQPGSLSMYRENDSFTIGCGVSLNGETSLAMPKKNMSLRFRDAYGDGMLEHDIYGGGVTEFTNLLLRAGQDAPHAIIRNELCQNLCEKAGMNVINQRSIWGILYINGQYEGIYTLKEKSNEQLFASVMGVSRDSVKLEEAQVAYGGDFYSEILDFTFCHDMTEPENYDYLCQRMDIDSLIDWLIIEGFCGNTDATTGNLRYAKSDEGDGKWHMMFYDLDAVFSHVGPTYMNLMTKYTYDNLQLGALTYPVTLNAEFRERFLTRAAELYSTVLTNEAILEEIDLIADELRPEVARDFKRYDKVLASWERNLDALRDIVTMYDWQQLCIDSLCEILSVEDDERAHYFGAIDGK